MLDIFNICYNLVHIVTRCSSELQNQTKVNMGKVMAKKVARETCAPSGTRIVIPPELGKSSLHDALEEYIATRRINGKVKLTKPAAIVEILEKQLGI